jgi:hypothetical protein
MRRMKTEDELWLGILAEEPALAGLAADEVREALAARGFPTQLISEFLARRTALRLGKRRSGSKKPKAPSKKSVALG